MTKDEARGIVDAQKRGLNVTIAELQTAVATLARTRDRRMRLPVLSETVKAKANLALVWNLWQAMGRIEERKAA